jgi:hypothetical protein
MVPSVWVVLETMPLTPNGKIDRKALPEPDASGQANEYVAPRNELEIKLAKIWEALLKVERVGIHDNFFELGGHSLLAMRVISSIRRQLETGNRHQGIIYSSDNSLTGSASPAAG